MRRNRARPKSDPQGTAGLIAPPLVIGLPLSGALR